MPVRCFKKSTLILCPLSIILAISPLMAADRTTPVTVNNTPSVNVSNTPNVNVVNVPVVSLSGTPSVSVTNTPNVAVTNTPSVTVSNVPTVNISPTNNTVQTLTKSNTILPWTTDQVIPNGGSLQSAWIDCNGYKEARVFLVSNTSATTLTASLAWLTGMGGSAKTLGFGTFSKPSTIPVEGNYQPWNVMSACYFIHPVFSNTCFIMINNTTGASVTISKDSWVYLVN